MAFKVGQKVVCIEGFQEWESEIDGSFSDGPKTNEILVIDFFERFNGRDYLGFNKYCTKEGYDPIYFRPIDYDFVDEVIKQVTPKQVEA